MTDTNEPTSNLARGFTADTERPLLTITEAAKAAGVDRRTIRRRLDAGDLPNASRGTGPQGPETGAWTIPVDDLIAAGFTLHASRPPSSVPTSPARVDQSELDRLRNELAEERALRMVAEARADERERLVHATEQRALNAEHALAMLTAGNESSTTKPEPSAPRRRWWNR
jgi:hypothetical protein